MNHDFLNYIQLYIYNFANDFFFFDYLIHAILASKEKTGGCLEKWFSDMKWLYEREDASAILEAFNVKPIVVDEIRLPITPDTSPDHSPIAKTTVSFSTNLLDAVGRNKVVDPFLSGDNETVDDAGINVTSAHKKRFSPKPPRSPSFRDSNTSITPKKTDNKLISDDKIIPDAHPISPGMKKLSLEKNLPPRSPYSRVSHVNEMVSDINDTPTCLKKSSLTGNLKPPRSPSLGVSNNSTSCRKAGGKLLLDSHMTLAEKASLFKLFQCYVCDFSLVTTTNNMFLYFLTLNT